VRSSTALVLGLTRLPELWIGTMRKQDVGACLVVEDAAEAIAVA
jgi:hypothetical protein